MTAISPPAHRPSRIGRYVLLVSAGLFMTFALVQPFANQIDPALLAMGACIALLVVPAMVGLASFRRGLIGVALFIPMLIISIAVGVLNGNEPSNIARSIIPYGIYIAVFSAFLLTTDSQKERLIRWFIYAALFVCIKTFIILVANGIGPDDFARGVRATFFDINSGLPIALAAIPLTIATIRSTPWRILILAVLTLQVALGLSKGLLGLTAIFYVAYFLRANFIGTSRQASMWSTLSKALIFGTVIIVGVATFDKNPLTQRFVLMVTDSKQELSGRTNEYRNVIEILADRPVFGRGQGFVFEHEAASSTDLDPIFEERRYAHSIVFYHWAIMGVFGMPFALILLHGPFFLLAGHMARDSFVGKKYVDDDPDDARNRSLLERADGVANLSFALLLSGFGLFAFNLVSASFKNPQSLIILALVNAATFAVLHGRKKFLRRTGG